MTMETNQNTFPDETADVPSRRRVLVVEDEEQVRAVVAGYLERDGFRVTTASNGNEAIRKYYDIRPDVIVLDLMLPEKNGMEVLYELRQAGSDTPVIVLSARGGEPDRVAGLDLGADDYVPKPASPREISARVKAVLRRTKSVTQPLLRFGDIEVDVAARTVHRLGKPVALRPKEFDLLVELASNPGEVMTRSDLLRRVWGSSPEWQDPGTVTVHVRRLRRLVEEEPAQPDHIVTVYGVGYRFDQ